MLSRRTLLLGGTASAAAVLGACSDPDDNSGGEARQTGRGAVLTGSFRSSARLGERTGWTILLPPGSYRDLPLVVALHGLGQSSRSLLDATFDVERHLADAVRAGTPPFAIAAPDGGTSYWHPRPSGEDAGAMVVDEFLPLLERRGFHTARIGLLGWSMGGYGALRLAGVLGRERVAAVAAASPAIWSSGSVASVSGFADAEEYARYSVLGHQDDLAGIEVRIDCGTEDPFCGAVQAYVDAFPDDADVTSSFRPGGHDRDYWRRMLPRELAFLGRHLGPGVRSTS